MAIWINGTEAKQTKQTAPKTKGKKNSQPTPEEPKTEVTINAQESTRTSVVK